MILAASVSIGTPAVALAEEAAGIWAMENGKVTVKVMHCGSGLCGRLVGLKEPLDKQGNPKLDRKNPDPTLRGRPLVGLTLFRSMKAAGANRWQGRIYVPDDGNTYNASIYLVGGAMNVQGCVAEILCQSQRFVRVNQSHTTLVR